MKVIYDKYGRLGRSLRTPDFPRAGTGFAKFLILIHEFPRNPAPFVFQLARSEQEKWPKILLETEQENRNPVPARPKIGVRKERSKDRPYFEVRSIKYGQFFVRLRFSRVVAVYGIDYWYR